MLFRCPKAAEFKLRRRNRLPKPLYCGIYGDDLSTAGGTAAFRLFRLLLLLRMGDRVEVEVESK